MAQDCPSYKFGERRHKQSKSISEWDAYRLARPLSELGLKAEQLNFPRVVTSDIPAKCSMGTSELFAI